MLRNRLASGAVLILFPCCTGKVMGVDYRFVRIADTRDESLFFLPSHHPAINNAGTVGFFGTAPGSIPGYYGGNGGSVSTIVTGASAPLADLIFEAGFSMNDSGQIGFFADKPTSDGFRVYRADPGGALTLIASSGAGTFSGFIQHVSINNSGNVGYTVTGSGALSGLYVGNGTANPRLYGGPIDGISVGSGPSLNNIGTVSFAGGDGIGGARYLKGAGETPSVIATTAVNDISSASESVINDGGLVVFWTTRFSAPTQGIFYGTGSAIISTFVDTDGPYSDLPNSGAFPALNNAGTIVFNATLDAGGGGIYTGADPSTSRVVQNGSTLFGRSLSNLFGGLSRDAINESGEIAFQAELLDGLGFSEAVVKAIPYTAQKWTHDGDGSWSSGGNWTGPVPNAYHHDANFTDGITAPRTVTVDGAFTVGSINFDNVNRYTIDGAGAITLDDSYAGSINVLSGTHIISAPLVMPRNTTINVSGGSSGLKVNNPLPGAAITLTKNGTGPLMMKNFRVGTLKLNAGVAQVAAGSGTAGISRVEHLEIAGGTGAWAATLNVSDNRLIMDYAGASPLDTVMDQIKSGYNGGAWTGTGIISSLADASTHAVGYADNTVLGLTDFGGMSVDPTSVLVKYTFYGDSDLDGDVDIGDLGNLASNWQTSNVWTGGDFDFNGTVNVNDLGLLASNWQAGVGSPLGPSFSAALASFGLPSVSVPEPAEAGLLLAAALACRRRRRK